MLSVTQMHLRINANLKCPSALNHLEYLISNNENGCSWGTGCRGRTGALVVCRHSCFAELSCQSPHTHQFSTQLRKSKAGRQRLNTLDCLLNNYIKMQCMLN